MATENRSGNSELKKGSAELLVLAVLEDSDLHGYQIALEIERRSRGTVKFHAASLYPLLYRLEKQGRIKGRWLEKVGVRRRRYYRLTAAGKKRLEQRRRVWTEFAAAVDLVAGVRHA